MSVAATVTDTEIRAAFEKGPLGILVTDPAARGLVSELLAEASALGIEAKVFFMDRGARLLADHAWIAGLPEAALSACDVSVRREGVDPPDRVNVAGQFHNAMMIADSAHVVSL